MAEPSAFDPSQIPAYLSWLGGIGSAIWAVWKYVDAKIERVTINADSKIEKLNTRLEEKADLADFTSLQQALAEHEKNATRHFEKLYQNAESDRKLTRDLHDQQMQTQSLNMHQILQAINSRK
jgi:hypothetical protein